MKNTMMLFAALMIAGCGNEAPSGTAATSTAAATQKPAATAAATATAAAPATAAAAPAAGAYRGLKEGHVVVGYIKDPNDAAQCGVLGASPTDKKLTDDELKKVADMLKGEVASTCPTENIVGACRAMGVSVQYYGPKYTKDTAQKECKGVWVD